MGKIDEPQNERSRRTRAAILDAAWELLEEQGAEHVSMAAVAQRAKVTRRGLYLHFAARAELLLALHDHADESLDLDGSIKPVLDAEDAVAALDEFIAHLARYHPKILRIDAALLRAGRDDTDLAALVDQGAQRWHDGCRFITQRLADEDRLAEPWTVDTAADLLWTFMFPDTLERLTVDRNWSTQQYRELLTVTVRRTLVADPPPRGS